MSYRLRLASFSRVNLELDDATTLVTADNLGAELEVDALLLQQFLGQLGDLGIHTWATDLVKKLDDGDLGTQPRPHGTHFQTDNTTTDDDHLLRDLREGESAGARDDALLIDLEAWKRGGLATSGNENVLTLDTGLAALVQGNLDLMLVDEGSSALDILDTVLLEQKLDALRQARDGCFLRLHHALQVELDIADLDTPALGVVEDLVVQVGVVEERLGRNTTDVETGATEGAALLNAGNLG